MIIQEKQISNQYIKGISIVIVTYNGSSRLKPTLEHLANQQGIDFNVELLVIDNCSDDGTSNFVIDTWSKLGKPFGLRVISEGTPGQMYARERGIKEAKYCYILYCDDDNWLNENYAKVAFDIISNNGEIAAVGGKGNITYEKSFTPPNWIERYEKNYGCTPQGRVDGDTTYNKGCLYTAGTLIDKKWLDNLFKLGFKPSLTGRIGKSLLGGEDTELTYALKLAGGKLYYSSKMEFKHYMPSERIQWEYLKRLWQSFGYSNFILSPYNYYFENKKYPNKYNLLSKDLIQWVKFLLIKLIRRKGEGDHSILEMEKKIGEIKAILFDYKKFCDNVKQIKRISKK